MELSAVIVATAALACVVLFVSERVAPALVAGAALAFLAVTGILSPGEALSGFSSTATVAVGSMFVISAGLRRTGVVRTVGAWLSRMLEAQPSRGRTGFFTGASLASAFINNTAVMAILMPVAIRIARRTDSSPSRWLMPLSFASMFGGVCTLLGTSTNLVASSVLEEHGYPGFAFFELAPVGLAFVGVGLVYVRWLQKRLPERRAGGSLTHSFSMHSYLSRARILSGSPLIGKRLDDRTLLAPGVEVVSVGRGGNSLQPREDLRLREGDALYICGPRELLRALEARDGLSLGLTELTDDDLENRDTVLLEVAVGAHSSCAGRPIDEIRWLESGPVRVLALRSAGRVEHAEFGRRVLRAGDLLLLLVPRDRRDAIEDDAAVVIISGEDFRPFSPARQALSVAIVMSVALAAASGLVSVAVAALTGALAMILFGCLSMQQAAREVDWGVLLLLAGTLALGQAFQRTGLDNYLAAVFLELGNAPRLALIGATYFLTMVLTAFMSNQATAALLAPVAISTAQSLSLDPRPFVVAVAVAASSSFFTPIGYQTNAMAYGAGGYRFADFLRFGGPLSLLLNLVAAVIIGFFWPPSP